MIRDAENPSVEFASPSSLRYRDAKSISIVAVHGMGARPDWTWTMERKVEGQTDNANKKYVNWLSDPEMLLGALPGVRILNFGYKTEWIGKQENETREIFVPDVAIRLLGGLEEHRKNVCSTNLDRQIDTVLIHATGSQETPNICWS